MTKAPSVFDWKGKPSIFMQDKLFASKQQGGIGLLPEDQPLRNLNASIATPGKHKQRPGTGKSSTS